MSLKLLMIFTLLLNDQFVLLKSCNEINTNISSQFDQYFQKVSVITQRLLGTNNEQNETSIVQNVLSFGHEFADLILNNKFSDRSFRSEVEQRRHKKKKKKISKYLLAAILALISITAPWVLKSLAIVAAKALLISKIAFVIVSIMVLKKILSD